MPESAEAHSATLDAGRSCTIQITNVSKKICLSHPKVFMDGGSAYSPPQPTVRTMKTEVCSFVKGGGTTGAAGVLVYDLFSMETRAVVKVMAVMFSVPYDYNIYKNYLGVGLLDPSRVDAKLFDHMYHKKEPWEDFSRHEADGNGIKFAKGPVTVRGCMSDDGNAIIKLELYDN